MDPPIESLPDDPLDVQGAATGFGWDDFESARFFEAFCERHDRYDVASQTLATHAALAPGQRVLDLAAGTGRTAAAIRAGVSGKVRIECVEPSPAMTEMGRRRVAGPMISWRYEWPASAGSYDRVVCSAAIWQIRPLPETFDRIHRLLARGGALCFNIPALYLGEPDEPGGGADPGLCQLPYLLSPPAPSTAADESAIDDIQSAAQIDAWLHEAGFRTVGWEFRWRMSQVAYRDWLKIPVLTNRLLPRMTADQRAERIDQVFSQVDVNSWRWERWRGWTAWKEGP